jgi:hypothetical protein
MYVAVGVIVGLGMIAGAWYLIANRGNKGGDHFDMGYSEPQDVPKGEDVWSQMHSGLSGQTVDATFNARPAERTAEMIERETTEFPDDLLDPRNPGHGAWEQREQGRTGAAGASPPSPDAAPDPPGAH